MGRILRAYVGEQALWVRRHYIRAKEIAVDVIMYWIFDPTGWVEETPTLEQQVQANGATDEALDEGCRCEHCGSRI